MGMYIGNPDDQNIVSSANARFDSSANGLSKLRKDFANEKIFDTNHTLARVAYRLGIKAKNDDNYVKNGRWFGLLHYIDTNRPAVATKIKGFLKMALDTTSNPKATSVLFSVAPYNGNDYDVGTQSTDPTYVITLLAPGHDYGGNTHPANAPFVPPRDNGEPHGSPLSVKRYARKPKPPGAARTPRRAAARKGSAKTSPKKGTRGSRRPT